MVSSVSPSYLTRLAQIESGGNPTAQNPDSTAKGLFQFVNSTARQYGLKDPEDPQQATQAVTQLTQDNHDVLSKALGREPTDGELYLAHQQGATGALKLLSNPNAPAVDIVGQKQVLNNGGSPDMTAGQFAGKWIDKFPQQQTQNVISGDGQTLNVADMQQSDIPEGFKVVGQQSDIPEGFSIVQPEKAQSQFDQRIKTGKDILATDENPILKAAQYAGNVGAGSLKDIIGNGIGAAYSGLMSMAPDNVKRGEQDVSNILSNIASSAPVQSALQKYADFSKENPKTSSTLDALGNFAAIATPINGESAASLTSKGLGAASKVAGAPLTGIGAGFKTIGAGIAARGPEALTDAANDIRSQASNLYKQSRDAGAIISQEHGIDIADQIVSAVKDTGKLNADLHKNTLSVLSDIKSAAEQGPLSLEEFDQFRQLLGDSVSKGTDITGKLDGDAYKSKKAIQALDKSVEGLKPDNIISGSPEAVDLLNQGRQMWQKYRKFDAVAQVVKKADGDPNKIKTALQRLSSNDKKTAGFTKLEKTALKKASSPTLGYSALKGLGRFGVTPGNVYLPIVTGGLASMAGGGPLGASLVGAGTVARQAQKYLARGHAEQLLKTIERN